MSVINKKPLISKVVSDLTAAEKNKLLLGLNGGLSKSVKVFNSLTTTDKDISLLDLKFDDGVKTGYLIYNDSVSVFIAFYSDTQRLSLFNLDITQHTYTSSREYLTIDELRNVVELGLIEQGEHLKVQADDIDSGSATAGLVLTADGEGGATWEEGGISEITPADITSVNEGTGTNYLESTPLVADGNGVSKWADFTVKMTTNDLATSSTTDAFLYDTGISLGGDGVDYDDGSIHMVSSHTYAEFITLIGQAIASPGSLIQVDSFDTFDANKLGTILSDIYAYKIITIDFQSGGKASLELDNKDIEFVILNGNLLPTTFTGKIHINDITMGNYDILCILSFQGSYFDLSFKAVPHVEENQFLAPEYDTTVSYVAGDLCLYLGVLYVCTANTSGTFDASDWQPTTIAGSVLGLLNTGV